SRPPRTSSSTTGPTSNATSSIIRNPSSAEIVELVNFVEPLLKIFPSPASFNRAQKHFIVPTK
ncbi:MAG: hypothetical protein JXM71_06590, partial [Spirochaetales bacterium]|nr:hypothetical protein [Spirochaetales bacterium]